MPTESTVTETTIEEKQLFTKDEVGRMCNMLLSMSQPVSLQEESAESYDQYIPRKSELFISFGTTYGMIIKVLKQEEFFPMYIWGVSGLGKTFQIEQACAEMNRPFFRVQVTKETTNEELIGSFILVNGSTKWVDGPVLKAYKSGGVLLLDEIDLNAGLMILQNVLENKPILVPQTGALIYPEKGFTIFATGNTKGNGDAHMYVGTTVLNEAFLERFVIIVEQKLPKLDVEEKMIDRYCKVTNISLEAALKTDLLHWIDLTRKNFEKGVTDIYISSRRVHYILQIYKVCGNFSKALELAVSRYSDEDKDALVKIWKAIKSVK